MGQDLFDASVGLAFSLVAFEKYRKNGVLSAELHNVPGIRGRCKGYLHLVEGKVVSCYIEDKKGQHYPIQTSLLVQVDNERGPFVWALSSPPPQPQQAPPLQRESHPFVPRIVALLDLDKMRGWPSTHKQILFQVYQMIDGQRSVEDIQRMLPFPPYVVEEAFHILSTLNVITRS